ncbi:tetratricopeptide repeat protein [Aliamphritea spongicola]|nr:tetratricopeptide repeat protein [Aliamphritea spongicola]
MAELRTEEEQVEALKKWWQENGKSLVLGVLLAGAIIFAWKGWQNSQQVKAETAAALYQNLIQAVALVRRRLLKSRSQPLLTWLATLKPSLMIPPTLALVHC